MLKANGELQFLDAESRRRGPPVAEGAGHEASYRFKHALIKDAAYDSLLKSRRQALHRRAAQILRDEPVPAVAEPEVIAHHFTEASLDDLAIEWWGALRRSAFQEAVAHLGKAIAMADKAAGGKAIDSGERQQLQVAYGNALFQTRGYGARETTEAFTRARESAYGHKDTSERVKVDYGLWAGSFVRGELHTARAHAAAFLSDVSDRPDSPDAGVAHRTVGLTHWFAGEYLEARNHLERALELFQPDRDDDLAYRFGQDAGAAAMFYLALALWSLGDIARAVSLVRGAEARTVALTHVGARAYGIAHAVFFELVRGNHGRVTQHAVELVRLAREHSMWRAFGVSLEPLVATESGAPEGGLESRPPRTNPLHDRMVLRSQVAAALPRRSQQVRIGAQVEARRLLSRARRGP